MGKSGIFLSAGIIALLLERAVSIPLWAGEVQDCGVQFRSLESGKYKQLEDLGWKPAVLRRVEASRPKLLDEILSKSKKDQEPITAYRGIGAPAKDYDPKHVGQDGRKFLSPSLSVAETFANEMVIEFQIPRYWLTSESFNPIYRINKGEIRLSRELLGDDQILMKRIGIRKTKMVQRGPFTEAETTIQWFDPEDILDDQGRVKPGRLQ